jgi:hypothetical protein
MSPPLVSFIAMQASGFANAVEKVSTEHPNSSPSVNLPAVSEPAMLAPAPPPAPMLGVPANAVA